MDKNYYEILGFNEEEKNLQGEEFSKVLTKKYRAKAMEYHPDRHVNDTEEEKKLADEKFKEVNEANSVLSDPEKRRNYDQFGTIDGNNFDPFDGFDPFGGFNPFGGFGKRMNKGEDINADVTLTEKEAFTGAKKDIRIKRSKPCTHCNGTGSEDGKESTCPHCNGSGRIRKYDKRGNVTMVQETFCTHCNGTGKIIIKPCSHCHGTGIDYDYDTMPFDIPAGVFNGATIVMERMGNPPKGKGINGDLYININVVESGNFERIRDNVVTKIKLTLEEALCGCEKIIYNVDGSSFKIKIPELTKCGETFTFSNKGYYNPKNGYRGDFIAVVDYIMPNKITKEQKELIKKFYELVK